MRGLKCFLTVPILLVVYGCTVETLSGYDEEGEVQTITVIGPAPINFKAIAGNIQTKGTSVRDDEALVFNWAIYLLGFLWWLRGKESACDVEYTGLWV